MDNTAEFKRLDEKLDDYISARSLIRVITSSFIIPSGIFFVLILASVISNLVIMPFSYLYGNKFIILINIAFIIITFVVVIIFRLVLTFKSMYIIIVNIIPVTLTTILTFIKSNDLTFIDGINYIIQLFSSFMISIAIYYTKEYYVKIIDKSFISFNNRITFENNSLRLRAPEDYTIVEAKRLEVEHFINHTKYYQYNKVHAYKTYYDFASDTKFRIYYDENINKLSPTKSNIQKFKTGNVASHDKAKTSKVEGKYDSSIIKDTSKDNIIINEKLWKTCIQ